MSPINLFSIIYVIMLICFWRKKLSPKERYVNLFIITCCIEINYFQGYFLKIGNSECSYDLAACFVFIMVSIWYQNKQQLIFDKETFTWCILFLASIFIGLIYAIFNPYEGYVVNGIGGSWDDYAMGLNVLGHQMLSFGAIVIPLIYIIGAMLALNIMKICFCNDDYFYIVHVIKSVLSINIIYGWIQLIVANTMNPDIFYKISEVIFGASTSTYTEAFDRGEWYVVQGFTREPSHFAFVVFSFLIFHFFDTYILNSKKNKLSNILMIVFTLILLLMIGSAASIIYVSCYFGVILGYVFINGSQKSKYIILGCCGALIAMFLSLFVSTNDSYLIQRINQALIVLSYIDSSAIIGMGNLSSALPRFLSIYETYLDFLERPLLGLGIGIEWCHSGWMSFLSYFGLLGMYLWFKVVFSQRKYSVYMIVVVFVVPHIFVGTIAWLFSISTIFIAQLLMKCFIKKEVFYDKNINYNGNI